jgi:hypothetical protein
VKQMPLMRLRMRSCVRHPGAPPLSMRFEKPTWSWDQYVETEVVYMRLAGAVSKKQSPPETGRGLGSAKKIDVA